MKLYTSLTSPYGRIARIVIFEKGLQDRVPVEVPITRQADSPYYAINPSGRVPYLVLDNGTGIEDSAVICEYLDYVDGKPALTAPPGPNGIAVRAEEARARSMLDGVSLWSREYIYRDPAIHSQWIIDHEKARADRMADYFEGKVEDPIFAGPLNLAQITLLVCLHEREGRPVGFDWRDGRPRLGAWVDRLATRSSVTETLPPVTQH